MGCKECGKPKCNGKCGCKSPKVLQINNPAEYITFHKVSIPAAMGDSTTNPPKIGAYRNALVYYEADHTSWMYSTDGIPTLVTGEQGPTGPQGPAGTITVGTTTTGDTGTDAEVENVGTPENAILNFTIPRGEQGDQGPQGEPGPQGYMNEQDVRNVVDTIIPEGFFDGKATASDCGAELELENAMAGKPTAFELKGNAEQQQYSGKNLVGLEGITFPYTLNGVTVSREDDGSFTFNGTLTSVTNFDLSPWSLNETYNSLLPFSGKTVTLSITRSGIASNLDFRNYGLKQSSGDTFIANLAQSPKTGTLNVTGGSAPTSVRLGIRLGGGTFIDWNIKIQLELGSSATQYERYVGGFASPNPLFPQDVNVVSGVQTVTVTGDSTRSYLIDLGNVKLVKLGDYQDYIYKNGTKWILHKETGYTYIDSLKDGSSYGINTTSNNTTRVVIVHCLNQIPISSPVLARTYSKCNRFTYSIIWNADNQGFYIDSDDAGTKNGLVFRGLKSTIGITAESVEAWLNNNPLDLYYVLRTASEEEITDEQLLAQLNAISLEQGGNNIVLSSDGLVGELCIDSFTNTRNGIEGIINYNDSASSERIENIEDVLEEVEYIFPQNFPGGQGDSSAIKAYGKNIMIDSSTAGNSSRVIQMLTDNGINHLDYFILSHYHTDHYGGIDALVEKGFINDKTVVYLPMYCNLVENSPQTLQVYNHFHDLFDNRGITYVEPTVDGTVLSISDEFNIYFYNVDREWFDNSGISDYNGASMLCYIKHGDIKLLYTGDAAGAPIDRLITQGYITEGLDFYKVEHHGINYSQTAIPRLLLTATQPDYAFVPANTALMFQNNISVSVTTSYLKSIGTKMYSSWNNDGQTKFISTIRTFKNVEGKPLASLSNAEGSYTIYVDANVTADDGIPDGTQEHPFGDLSQALGYCNGGRDRVTIRLADGVYNASHLDLHDKDIPRFGNLNVSIIGNSEDNTAVQIIDGMYAYNSIVNFAYCTLVSDIIESVRLMACNSEFENCIFTSSAETPGSANNAVYSESSRIAFNNCTFRHLNLGLSTHYDDILVVGCTFDDISQTAIYLRISSIYVGSCTFTDSVNSRFYRTLRSDLRMNPVLLYNGTAMSGAITLNDDIRQYNKLIVQSGRVIDGTYCTDEILTYGTEMFALGKTYKCNSDSGKITLTVDSSSPTVMQVSSTVDQVRMIYGLIYPKG